MAGALVSCSSCHDVETLGVTMACGHTVCEECSGKGVAGCGKCGVTSKAACRNFSVEQALDSVISLSKSFARRPIEPGNRSDSEDSLRKGAYLLQTWKA